MVLNLCYQTISAALHSLHSGFSKEWSLITDLYITKNLGIMKITPE